MSKLKPLSKDEDLNAIPLNQPVLVELEPAAAAGATEPERPEAAERPERDEADPGVEKLKGELAASQEATRLANEAAAQAREAAAEREREIETLRATQGDTEKELLTNSLTAAQADEEAARAEFERAFEAGDAKAIAAAHSKISRAAAKVLQFEGAVAELDTQAKREKERRDAAPAPAQRPTDIVARIDADPNFLPAEKVWLKQHPEMLTDPIRNKELEAGYYRAMRAGKARGTPAYFKFLETFLELDADTGAEGDAEGEGRTIVSAPVSRGNGHSMSGRPASPSRITLTPAEREMARNMGVSDVEYARGKVQLEANKRADPLKFASR